MRKLFTKIHRWVSIPLGAVIAIVCLTGALLVFETEITRALQPHLYRVEALPGQRPLAPSELTGKVLRQLPETLRPTTLELACDPAACSRVTLRSTAHSITLSVNPYTGEILGEVKRPAFFQYMRKLHRWLFDAPPAKGQGSVGKRVVGITTLMMIPILVSGLLIWIPPSRKALKNRLKISCRNGRRRFWYDSHVAAGFYATALLLVMALTGLTWSFGWYRTAAYTLFGGTPSKEAPTPQRKSASPLRETIAPQSREQRFDPAVWNRVAEELRRQYPDARSIELDTDEARIVRTLRPIRRSDTAIFDPADGSILKIVRFEEQPRSQQLRAWFFALHTGSWGGMISKILYLLAALVGASLPLTGYYLWLRRRGASVRNRPSRPA